MLTLLPVCEQERGLESLQSLKCLHRSQRPVQVTLTLQRTQARQLDMEFRELVTEVENNMENIDTCNELFEDFITAFETNHEKSSDSFELAMLLLCLGRYPDSFNIIRNMEVCQEDTAPQFESLEDFFSARQLTEERGEADVDEDVEWLLPRPHRLPCSPYQYLFLGQVYCQNRPAGTVVIIKVSRSWW